MTARVGFDMDTYPKFIYTTKFDTWYSIQVKFDTRKWKLWCQVDTAPGIGVDPALSRSGPKSILHYWYELGIA